MFLPRFYFTDGASDNGGGGSDNNSPAPVIDQPAPLITEEELKGYGLDRDQFKALLQSHKENSIPAEQKQKEEQLRKADLIKFAAENDLMKVEDFNTYESLKSKSDRDLRFDTYLKEWKEENPDITDADEITSQAKIDFETEYKLNSDNAKQRERGEARLAKEAAELRNPYTSKYEQAQSSYQERKAMEGKLPEFNKFIDTLIEKCTPEKLSISKVKDGEEEVGIEVELTAADRKELAEKFRTPKTFLAYSKETDPAKLEPAITKKINGFLKEKYFDNVVSKTFELGKGRGVVKGSNIGAEQPFSVIRGNNQSPSGKENNAMTLEQSNDKIAAARRRFAR